MGVRRAGVSAVKLSRVADVITQTLPANKPTNPGFVRFKRLQTSRPVNHKHAPASA